MDNLWLYDTRTNNEGNSLLITQCTVALIIRWATEQKAAAREDEYVEANVLDVLYRLYDSGVQPQWAYTIDLSFACCVMSIFNKCSSPFWMLILYLSVKKASNVTNLASESCSQSNKAIVNNKLRFLAAFVPVNVISHVRVVIPFRPETGSTL